LTSMMYVGIKNLPMVGLRIQAFQDRRGSLFRVGDIS